MVGSLIDLKAPGVGRPSPLVVDSGVVIDWLVAESRVSTEVRATLSQSWSIHLIRWLQREQVTGLLTSVSLAEVMHFAIKSRYRAEIPNYQTDLMARFPRVRRHDWQHLFKARSDLMRQFAPGLDHIRRLLDAGNLLILQPDDLGSIPSSRSLDEELVRTMERYELDSNDAAILVEVRRAGLSAIASGDADFQRAQLDFDVYTWL